MSVRSRLWFGRLVVALGLGVLTLPAHAGPVTFQFQAPAAAGAGNPFARELWAEVITPSGRTLSLPAYYDGDGHFVIHARPDTPGTFRLGPVSETIDGKRAAVAAESASPREVTITAAETMPTVQRDPVVAQRFLRSDGVPFVPVGANVAWREGNAEPVKFYEDAFARFGAAGLNWMRIWMCHWGNLNLDWHPAKQGPSPTPGTIDPAVAARWDRMLELAEQHQVYVQVVLQHHGQYATRTNPNWAENPWNAANPGGFLKTPEEFFTSATARRLTKLKYRYSAARWGWSPAVFAWELFNEVHWVDAMATTQGRAEVAAWHSEMAEWLRSVDAYQHLIGTSTEDLRSACYEKMDFYQPHLYAAELISGARRISFPGVIDRPVFYGEQGDDHLDVSDDVKESGRALVPPVWAGLFGQAHLPAQPWLGATLLRQNRAAELGAVARFVAATHFAEQSDLQPFSAVVESAQRVALRLTGSMVWQRRPAPDIEVPLDGRRPIELGDVPRIYSAPARDEEFPTSGTYHFDYPRATTLRVHVARVGEGEPRLEVLVNGRVAASHVWSPDESPACELDVPVAPGRRIVTIRNVGRKAWIEIPSVDLGTTVSPLAAIGQRGSRLIALWVWNQPGLYAESPSPVEGTVVLEDVPPGEWRVTWWDTATGTPLAPIRVVHHGGVMRLPSPAVARHAAVVLSR